MNLTQNKERQRVHLIAFFYSYILLFGPLFWFHLLSLSQIRETTTTEEEKRNEKQNTQNCFFFPSPLCWHFVLLSLLTQGSMNAVCVCNSNSFSVIMVRWFVCLLFICVARLISARGKISLSLSLTHRVIKSMSLRTN